MIIMASKVVLAVPQPHTIKTSVVPRPKAIINQIVKTGAAGKNKYINGVKQ